ncbi:MAG: DUF429 domain-containing protein [Candidatus Thermoplasmatota archaeon]|nr:DUF429 domain-containing protein [Candidatus Thermoplasmatota archaeon]
MRKILGVDIAGKDSNPTGICTMINSKVKCCILYSDEEILKIIDELKPDIIAIDAPVMEGEPRVRKADRLLKKYGAFPPSLPSMRSLTMRGSKLAVQLKTCYKVIEVFPTATAKILNVYNKNYKETIKKLGIKAGNKHELDAYLCALTAKLFLEKKTVEIGDETGKIVVPKS